MTKIELGKKYRHVGNKHEVRILCVDGPDQDFPVIGVDLTTHNVQGFPLETTSLEELNPYDGFEIDDLVLVSDVGGEKLNVRYFAGVNAYGYPLTWVGGATSVTINNIGDVSPWEFCRKTTKEEVLKLKAQGKCT